MTQALPSGATDADRIARTLARLRGPEIQPADGTLIAEDLRVQGGALGLVRATVRRAIAQAHPGTATDLLAELEDEYGLGNGSALSESARQVRLLAKHRARGDGSLLAIATTVRTVVPDAVLLTIAAEDVAGTDPDAVFNLVVLVSLATLNDAGLLAQIDALLAQQLAGEVVWSLGRGDGGDDGETLDDFLCDDPDSLVEIDLLSA
ncbi:MAG: hypothetical protein ACEQSX_01570 [Baekduiaceae bacterium]